MSWMTGFASRGAHGAAFLRPLFAASLAATLLLAALPAHAERPTADCCDPQAPRECDTCRRPGDELWLVDVRDIGCLDDGAAREKRFGYWRYDAQANRWRSAKADEFFGGKGAELPTC